MESYSNLFPLIPILLFVPLAIWGNKLKKYIPFWVEYAVLSLITSYFIYSMFTDPELAQKHRVFAFFGIMLILVRYRQDSQIRLK